MGNEALRSSRHSASSSSFRRSTRRGSKSGQNYIAEDEVDSGAKNGGANMEICAQSSAKPARRLDKIRRSLSFRKKKKSKATNGATSSGGDLAQAGGANMTTSISAPLTINASTVPAILPASASTSIETARTAHQSSAIKSASTSQVTETATAAAAGTVATTTTAAAVAAGQTSKPVLWMEDEKRVRANNCSFQVKYLGSQEVADSRGMHICEQAIERMLVEKKKPIKAILYVSGDSLRVVDELNKTLLVDQTIEKVSFCAPDRHHENGFAYICRDGTTRRWLCHGFMAAKDTLKGTATGSSGGERLSHAVGCAFSVCLEKKQRRERDTSVSMEVGPNHSFTRLGSFRQASLTERLEDPQIVMPAAQPVPIKAVDNPHAIERPKPNLDTFNRQNPLRATGALQMPFKRNAAAYSSLKPGELPSFQQQKISSGFGLNGPLNSPTSTSSSSKTSLLLQQHQLNQQQQAAALASSSVSSTNNFNRSDTLNRINTISELPEEQLDNSNTNLSTNATATDSTSKLAEQMSTQLNIQTAVPSAALVPSPSSSSILQPTPAPPPPPPQQQATTIGTISPQDAVLLQQHLLAQQQQLQQQYAQLYQQMQPTSIFATPPSLPVTPPTASTASTTNLTNAEILSFAQAQPATPLAYNSMAPQPTMFYSPGPNGTPQLMQMMPVQYMNGMQQPAVAMMAVPTSSIYAAAPTLPGTTGAPSTPLMPMMGVNSNETFEQKWARIQAAKKTNPFAEDIAKKFEIKL